MVVKPFELPHRRTQAYPKPSAEREPASAIAEEGSESFVPKTLVEHDDPLVAADF